MTAPEPAAPQRRAAAEVAALAGVIERAGAAIALGEEPSNFSAALENGAEPDTGAARP
jgi:hypothetical protein